MRSSNGKLGLPLRLTARLSILPNIVLLELDCGEYCMRPRGERPGPTPASMQSNSFSLCHLQFGIFTIEHSFRKLFRRDGMWKIHSHPDEGRSFSSPK